MKNLQKGFVPIVIIIIAVIVIGGGAYYVFNKSKVNKSPATNNTTTELPANPDNPTQEETLPNYVVEKDIKTLKYFDTDIDNKCNILPVKGPCTYYKADYAVNGNQLTHNAFSVSVELHSDLAKENFVNSMESEYKNLYKKGSSLQNNYYTVAMKHDSGTSENVIWFSGGKVVLVSGLNPTEATKNRINDLLEVYLTKYPSEL